MDIDQRVKQQVEDFYDEHGRVNLQAYAQKHPHIRPTKAQEMERYMKNQFPFVGVGTPERRALCKPLFKASRGWELSKVLTEVQHYYERSEREYQYVAIDLLQENYKRLTWSDWEEVLLPLINEKPWWDTVDGLRKPLGLWLLPRPNYLKEVVKRFVNSSSIWERRISIIVQLLYKERTDLELLTYAIENNMNEDEFFIQKAIGWALREHSKTDPSWVQAFINSHALSTLAKREGSKYI